MYRKFFCSVAVGLSLGLLSHLPEAHAADKLTIKFSGIEQPVSIPELRKFVDTGEQSSTIQGILGAARINPDALRSTLGMTIDLKQYDVDVVFMDRLLNSYVAEIFLQELGRSFHPPRTEAASVQAIRSTIIAATADDNKISAIEILEKYPTELVMEGERVNNIYQRLSKDYQDLGTPLQKIFQRLQQALQPRS
jgi:hypothetical protein